jgi:beta-fructofuranosidase
MPVFWKHGDKSTLLVNKVPHKGVPAKAMYWTGEFKNEKFVPDHEIPQNLEVINRLLSPSVSYDKNGLITAIAIIPDEIGGWAAYNHGWTHLYSIPRVWNFNEGTIEQSPHPVLKELRDERQIVPENTVSKEQTLKLADNGNQMEIKATISPNGSKRFGFYIHKNADNSEFTKIYYDAVSQEIIVDQQYSSLKKYIPLRIRKGKYKLNVFKSIDFHLFIDGSVVEVFINNKDAFTTRIFPLRNESNQVEVFTEGGDIQVEATVWRLKAAQIEANF